MKIKASAAGLLTALALISGGAMTACSDPSDANTGTPKDTAQNTDGADPGSVSQGSLPSEGQPGQTASTDRNDDEDSDK